MALGKGQNKKLPPLPDAKLFKDNAPAKVDQRRVSTTSKNFWLKLVSDPMPPSHPDCSRAISPGPFDCSCEGTWRNMCVLFH